MVELDYVLSESTQTTQSQQTGLVITETVSSTSSVSTPKTTTTTTTSSTPPKTTPKKSLSKQDEADMRALLNAIVE